MRKNMGSRGRVVEWTGVEGNGGKCAGGKEVIGATVVASLNVGEISYFGQLTTLVPQLCRDYQ
nr:hypothetical protein [Tanacetum cinerariifolium]